MILEAIPHFWFSIFNNYSIIIFGDKTGSGEERKGQWL